MAFVFKKERFDDQKQDINETFYIGPETYDVKKSVAPFNSTAPRIPEKVKKTETPSEFDKYFRILDKKKELVYQKVKETKKDKKPSFSTEPRFKPDDTTNLGPGTYNTYSHELYEFARKVEKPSIVARQPVSKPSAIVRSSIPYKPRDPYDDISANERSVLVHTGTNRKIGPGTYDPMLPNDNRGVTNWQRAKAKQLMTEELMNNGNPKLGPGAYNPKYEPSLQYKEKTFSVFVEAKTNSKAKFSTNSEWVKNATPGPGYYNPKLSSVPIKKKMKKYELFGVSVPRFAINYNDLTAVGPGSYELSKNIINYDFYNTKIGQMNFGENQARFKDIENNIAPGPGTYINKVDFVKNTFNKKNKFIDQHPRFIERKEEPEPKAHGPEFEMLRVVKAKQEKAFKLRKQKKQDVPFMSNLERDNFGISKDKLPAVGLYDPKNYELSYQIEQRGFSKNKHVAFLSKTTRFNSVKELKDKDKENSFTIDNMTNSIFRDLPTYHDYPKNNVQAHSLVFKSKVNRFDDDKKINYRFYGQRPEWNLKSFNINF